MVFDAFDGRIWRNIQTLLSTSITWMQTFVMSNGLNEALEAWS